MYKKKVALFLFPTDRLGGAERVTKMIADVASKSRDFDEVVCFVLSKESTGTLEKMVAEQNVTVVHTRAKSELRGVPALVKQCAGKSYELVFSSHGHMNAAASLLRKIGLLRTTRLVTRESTLIFERDLGWKGWLVKVLYRLYGGQDLIVCQTERMAKSLSRNTGGKLDRITEVIPNPIDLSSISSSMAQGAFNVSWIPSGSCAVGWCGRLSEVKSPFRALETLSVLLQLDSSDFHLVMIGDGPLRAEVEQRVKELGLEGKVTLTGYHSDPPAVLKRCQLGLVTSDIEGFPNVILEMLASGVKGVVTTNCAGGLNDIPGVFVSNSAEPNDLAIMIESVRRNEGCDGVATFLRERDPHVFLRKICDGNF